MKCFFCNITVKPKGQTLHVQLPATRCHHEPSDFPVCVSGAANSKHWERWLRSLYYFILALELGVKCTFFCTVIAVNCKKERQSMKLNNVP